MKIANYLLIIVLMLLFSCNKEINAPVSSLDNTESKPVLSGNEINKSEGDQLFKFEIPEEHRAAPNSSVFNIEKEIEVLKLKDGTILNVMLECVTAENGKVISIGVSENFCSLMDINNTSLIIGNQDEIDFEHRSNGWLSRFFLGNLEFAPCTYGRRITWRDPWWGPAYEVSGPAGDPC